MRETIGRHQYYISYPLKEKGRPQLIKRNRLPIQQRELHRVQLQLHDLIPFDHPTEMAVFGSHAGPSHNFDLCGSTAVILTNPRLHEDEHVHGRFVECEGLGELAERVTTPGCIELSRELIFHELLQPDLKDAIVWGDHYRQDYHSIEIYTDGSKLWCAALKQITAGWAVIVTGVDQHGRRNLLGTIAGRVITSREDPWCMGAQEENSDTAEVEAMIWAVLWALQAQLACRDGCEIVSDHSQR